MKSLVPARVGYALAWVVALALMTPAALAQRATSPAKRPSGPIYYVVPLEGEVGVQMTAKLLSAGLEHAVELKPDVVILDINSPGGFVSEMMEIFDVLINWQRRHPQQRVVAVVREQALSAAAMIAMTVKEIYMMPGTTIGAAMVINVDESGKADKVSEKVESAVKAKARTAAEFGGHNPLIVEAMIDTRLQLFLVTDDNGKPLVTEGHNLRSRIGGGKPILKVFTERGKLLTLTAEEAVACGLSVAVVNNYDELMTKLDLAGAREHDDFARKAVTHHNDNIDRIVKEFERLGTLINKLQAGATLTSLADVEDQRRRLAGVQGSIRRIEKMAEEHGFLKEYLDANFGPALEAMKMQLARDQVTLERLARDARARMRRTR